MPLRTPSGRKTKLGDFESKIKGTMPDSEMYAIANKQGLMRGNQATAKGARPARRPSSPRMPGFGGRKIRSRVGR
jgi:hypothetical protein